MNVASLELSKKLHELSGWEDCTWVHPPPEGDHTINGLTWRKKDGSTPAYDCGYLLRKLPRRIQKGLDIDPSLELVIDGDKYWFASYSWIDEDAYAEIGDNPEDALCKLAIELFEEGVLNDS